MFSIAAVALYIPTDSAWGSSFSTSSPVLDILNFRIVFYVVIFCFFDRYEVGSHGFDLCFSND